MSLSAINDSIKKPSLPLAQNLANQCVAIEAWFRQQWQQTPPPIYGSVDLRNAGFKLAPVDTNLFPAGFNNLNPVAMPLYVQAIQATVAEICPQITRFLLIPESHTRNPFYFENIAVLSKILTQAGFKLRIGSLDEKISTDRKIELASGESLLIEPVQRYNSQLGVKDFFPCTILLNNDLSEGIPPSLHNLSQLILPAPELGWATRLKSEHFRYYQQVCEDFAQTLDLDPWLMMPYFDQCPEIDFRHPGGQECLVDRAKKLLAKIKEKYQQYQIQHQPFLVVKADQGTYGMAVMMIDQPEELAHLNRKQRTKMSVSKGGIEVTRVIIQEGVHSFETAGPEQAVAEPVIYTIGRYVIGGFYRVHQHRGPKENLNAPGMDFQPLPFQKPCHIAEIEESEQHYYAYGVVARLALLAAAKELAALAIQPPNKEDCHD